jgi:hypothetical protein
MTGAGPCHRSGFSPDGDPRPKKEMNNIKNRKMMEGKKN